MPCNALSFLPSPARRILSRTPMRTPRLPAWDERHGATEVASWCTARWWTGPAVRSATQPIARPRPRSHGLAVGHGHAAITRRSCSGERTLSVRSDGAIRRGRHRCPQDARTFGLECCGGLAECGAGGDDVVDDQDTPTGEARAGH